MYRFFGLLSLLLVLTAALPTLASPPGSPAAQTTDCNSVTEIPVSECQALMALYTGSNGPGWGNHTGWGTTNTPCSWYGVTCAEGHVTMLDLSYNQLSGSIPPQLGSLTGLQSLNLYGNQLSGSIPPQLGSLASLQALILSGNQLSGSIPPQLGSLASLQSLDLYGNQLSGSIPPELGSLTSLQYLDLYGNQLSGSIPPQLGSLTSLQSLFLYDNQLSGSIPPQLGSLASLQALILSGNQLSGSIPPQLANLPGETYLDLDYNMLTASGTALLEFLEVHAPTWAATQTVPPADFHTDSFTAFTVSLSWTPIQYTGDGGYYIISYATTPGGPYTVAGQTADKNAAGFTVTGLDYNQTYSFVVQSYTPAHGDQQNNLLSSTSQEIAVTTAGCNGVTEIPVAECEALMALYTSTNGPGWGNHTGWGTTNTPCSWRGVTCSGGRVIQLHLPYNQLSGSIPSQLGSLASLLSLDLHGNQLSGSIPPQLGSLANLQYLYLHGNQLSGSIPPELGSLANLQRLYLSDNQLSGSIPPQLGNLTGLQMLYLNRNQLSGSIPPQLGSLASLRHLGLSGNQLSGSIPPQLGSLANLQELYLYDNQLSGSIPPQLGSLTSLQYLLLDNNQLSGSIPPELANLTILFYLDLRYNMLTASDTALLGFLASKQGGWANTQTVAPANVQFVAFAPSNGVSLSWTPILYKGDGGYYVISYAKSPNGPYTVAGQTADKTVSSYTVTGLNYGTTYYFAVESYTPAHGVQQNNLLSSASMPASATISAANAAPQRGSYATGTPTLTWNPVLWAAGYEVQVAKSTSFLTSTLVYTKADVPAGVLSVTVDTPPLDDGPYHWRVRAIRANGSAGAWSAVDSFVVDAP